MKLAQESHLFCAIDEAVFGGEFEIKFEAASQVKAYEQFQSTLLHEERQRDRKYSYNHTGISIHAPA